MVVLKQNGFNTFREFGAEGDVKFEEDYGRGEKQKAGGGL